MRHFGHSKKAQKDQQMHFMAVKESRKPSGFGIYSHLKDTHLHLQMLKVLG